MKRVKLYTSVAQVDGVTYSPGDVIELSDEDAQYLIDHGQGVETTDQVTDVAAREASEGTDHAIRVDVQHGEAQDIITVVPSDPDKKLPASEGGDDPDPAPADDAKAAGGDSAGDEPHGSADVAPAEPATPATPADDAAVEPAEPDAEPAQPADEATKEAADAAPVDDAGADAPAEQTADAAPADAAAEPEPADDATPKTTPKKRGRGRPRKNS